jgi:hypothetical protein
MRRPSTRIGTPTHLACAPPGAACAAAPAPSGTAANSVPRRLRRGRYFLRTGLTAIASASL